MAAAASDLNCYRMSRCILLVLHTRILYFSIADSILYHNVSFTSVVAACSVPGLVPGDVRCPVHGILDSGLDASAWERVRNALRGRPSPSASRIAQRVRIS